MKKVFFIAVIVIICALFYLNQPQEKVTNEYKEVKYITIEGVGNVKRPGKYKVPEDITLDEVLTLFDLYDNTIYLDFTIKDGLIINFEQVVANPIIIQTATTEELDSLPEIGLSRVNKIIEYRETNGGFMDWNTFFSVVGINNATDQYNIKKQAILR